jgi:uncharacterized protein YjbJ (UPF0337 family)
MMKGSAKVAKGRIEEAAGVLGSNDTLRTKGRAHQALGRVQQAADSGIRRARESARKIVDKAKNAAKQTVDKYKGGV